MDVTTPIVRMPPEARPMSVVVRNWNPLGHEMVERLERAGV